MADKDVTGIFIFMCLVLLVVAVGAISYLVALIFHDGASSW